MSETVIQVEHLWKQYRLGVVNHHTLTLDLQSWWARVRRREDPNSILGAGGAAQNQAEHFWALRDVSFEVRQGGILGIIGRNGAGKSTLLKILSQVTAPTRGEVRYKGRIASLLEVGTGFHPELTGRENVFLNGAILGMSKEEIRRKFDEIVDFAEIERFIDTPVKRYSSGMYVRLAFAVAAHLDPEILIVDEVLAVGDASFQRKCLGKMGDVAGGGRTVLFVSHNMQAVKRLCTRGILLDRGRLVQSGSAEEVVEAYLSSGHKPVLNCEILPEMHRDYPAGLEVVRMEIMDSQGEPTTELLLDEPLSFRLHYRIHTTGCGYRIGVVVSTWDHLKVATLISSGGDGKHLYGEQGRLYRVTVQAGNILKDGKYLVGLHIKNSHDRPVDVIEGFSFTVLPVSKASTPFSGQGIVRLDAQWSEAVALPE